MIRVFLSPVLQDLLTPAEQTDLMADFQQYKATGIPADYFGRDAPYDHPHTLPRVRQAELQHLHLIDPARYPARTPQYQRTSDDHLVYCPGFFQLNHYLLLAILMPSAHAAARDNSIMASLADLAERFRGQY